MRAVLALIVGGLIAGLLLAEGAARLYWALGCEERASGFAERDRAMGWRPAPGVSGWARRCHDGRTEWETWVEMNAGGMRDGHVALDRTPGVFRILVLGDSFVEGREVALDDTWVKRLERRLGRVEVINGGVSGYGTDNARLRWRHELWRYHPDLVLLAFFTFNDVGENHHGLATAMGFYPDKPYWELDDGHLVLRRFPLPPQSPLRIALGRFTRMLTHRSALFRLVTRAVNDPGLWSPDPQPDASAPAEATVKPIEVYRRDETPAWREAWRITRGLVLGLRADVERHGARFAVVVLNAREEVTRSPPAAAFDVDAPNRRITAFLRRRGIPYVALIEPLRAAFAADPARGYFPNDIHWTPAGHAVAATAVADGLATLGLLPPSVHVAE